MPKKLTDQDLVNILNTEFHDALGAPSGDISLQRAEAYDFYLSKPFGDEEEGYSKVVTSDVADVVDSIMPSLLRLFTTAENLVNFDPVGPEDEAQAQQESDYVNYIFFKLNDGFGILYQWFFDALVQKNGITRADWDTTEERSTESYEGLSESELLELLADDELEPVERSEREAETVDEETGQIVRATVHDITFRRVSKRGFVHVQSVPPEEYRVSNDVSWLDPSPARMVGQEREVVRDELLRMGFDEKVVEKLGAETEALTSPEEFARKDTSDEARTKGSDEDKSQDQIILREGFLRVDADGDGKSELTHIFAASTRRLTKDGVERDSHFLDQDEADRQPFHVICPSPLPHKHFGRATADKVMDVQLFSSHFLRNIFDNLYQTNRPGHAVYSLAMGENTMDQLLTSTLGRVVEFDRPVNESHAPLTVPFTAKETFPLVEYFDKVKRDRTGVSADSEGLSPEALKNIQQTVLASSLDLSRMKIEAIARIFAETGIKSLFRHIHELVRKHSQKAEVVKLRGQWVRVDPREWKHRRNMTVNIGLGIGTREQNLVHLEAIWQKQAALIENGWGFMAKPMNVFRTVSEIVRNANLKTPELYFSNPGDAEAPPPSDQQAQLQRQQLELQQRQQQLDAERQQINSGKLQLQAQEQQLEAQKEAMKLRLDAAEQQRKREKDQDDLMVSMEEIRTKLTDLELKYSTNVPGAAT